MGEWLGQHWPEGDRLSYPGGVAGALGRRTVQRRADAGRSPRRSEAMGLATAWRLGD